MNNELLNCSLEILKSMISHGDLDDPMVNQDKVIEKAVDMSRSLIRQVKNSDDEH